MESKTKTYRVEIPFRACGWIDVERDTEPSSEEELYESITRDELCEMNFFNGCGYELDDIENSVEDWHYGMEKTIYEINEDGEEVKVEFVPINHYPH